MLSFLSRTRHSTSWVSFQDWSEPDEVSGLRKLLITRDESGAGNLAIRGRPFRWLVCPRHAWVTRDRYNRYFVMDISQNGTYVNDVRIAARAPHQLVDGDVISLGAQRQLVQENEYIENPYTLTFLRCVNGGYAPRRLRHPSLTRPCRTSPARTALARGRRRPRNVMSEQTDRDAVMGAVSCTVCSHAMTDAHNLPCGHVFCKSCGITWLSSRTTCPTCRAPAAVDDMRPVIGFGDLSEVAVRSHGTRDDIAAFHVRRQHDRLAEANAQPLPPQRQASAPTLLVPESSDDYTVLLRGHVDGNTRYFMVFRDALEAL